VRLAIATALAESFSIVDRTLLARETIEAPDCGACIGQNLKG